jgi:hypothetical protein
MCGQEALPGKDACESVSNVSVNKELSLEAEPEIKQVKRTLC